MGLPYVIYIPIVGGYLLSQGFFQGFPQGRGSSQLLRGTTFFPSTICASLIQYFVSMQITTATSISAYMDLLVQNCTILRLI